jgi:hypothetical protein
MKYGYKIPRFGDDIIGNVGATGDPCGEMLAQVAAEDFHSHHDGWECSWPLDFVILREDGSEVGRYIVERETVPEFFAYPTKAAK